MGLESLSLEKRENGRTRANGRFYHSSARKLIGRRVARHSGRPGHVFGMPPPPFSLVAKNQQVKASSKIIPSYWHIRPAKSETRHAKCRKIRPNTHETQRNSLISS